MTNATTGKRNLVALIVAATLLASVVSLSNVAAQDATSPLLQTYKELFARSEKEKKGLTFYLSGQTIGAVFVKMIGNDAVEVRNQTYGRIIIRLDSVDAIAIN
jgi:hypothetical protein